MQINIQTLDGTQIRLEIDSKDSVKMIKLKLVDLIFQSSAEKINLEQIRLYCGNNKLKNHENFWEITDSGTKQTYMRLAPLKIIPKQTPMFVGQYSFFAKVQTAFSHTKLATDYSFNPTALQQNKANILTKGAIPRDIMMLEGYGATMQTDHGTLIDLSSQTSNCILGLNDPWVTLREMSYKLSTQPQYATIRVGAEAYLSYAQRLSTLLSAEGMQDYVINHRQCNGSDVVELAIHAAFNIHKTRKKIATFSGSYHGQNLLAAMVSEHQPSLFLVDQPPQVEFFPIPSNETATLKEQTQQTLNILRTRGKEFAAILIEPLQVRNAVHACPIEFLKDLRTLCDELDICLIFDEIQTGFGWLGTLSFSGSHGLRPDIACFSKAVTAGYGALSVMLAHKKYADGISPTFSGKTNSGSLSTIIAADAVLDRLCGIDASQIPDWLPDNIQHDLKIGLMTKIPNIAEQLLALLKNLQALFPDIIGKITGQGLVRGLEILSAGKPDEKLCAWLVNQAFEDGVYLRQSGHALLFKPALVITENELQIALKNLQQTFQTARQCLSEAAKNGQPLPILKSHG